LKPAHYWLLVAIWMAIIFAGSADRQSFPHSSRIIAPILRWLVPGISDAAVHSVVVVVRKGAHVSEYAVLALLLWQAMSRSSGGTSETWPWRRAAWTLLVVLLYAASDELHQSFVPAREGSVIDVLIDTTGAVLALLFLWSFGRWRRSW
jgi:VanZ family protein